MPKRREFTTEFKREAVRLASQEGATFAQVARDLGVGANLISRRKRKFEKEGEKAFPGRGHPRDEEIARLKRELGMSSVSSGRFGGSAWITSSSLMRSISAAS